MIVTVTPNPSFDKTVSIDTLDPGEVHRISTVTVEAGGKGVNVSRALALSGVDTACVFPGNAQDIASFGGLLGDVPALRLWPIDTATSIRTNVSVIEADGRTTKLNEAGDPLGAEQQERLIDAVTTAAATADWVALCGSLPPGVEPTFVRDLQARLGGTARLVVDASGAPLAHAVDAGIDLVKPNHEELAELLGRPLTTLGDVIDGAHEVCARGVSMVLVSLGGDGALLVTADDVIFGSSPATTIKNTVGAGDAFLAGFLAGGGSGSKALSEALAWGRAAVASASTAFPPATDADRAAVVIADEPDRSLHMEG